MHCQPDGSEEHGALNVMQLTSAAASWSSAGEIEGLNHACS